MSTNASIHVGKGDLPKVEMLTTGCVAIVLDPKGSDSCVYLTHLTDGEADAYLETMIAQCALMREQLWGRAAVRSATDVISSLP